MLSYQLSSDCLYSMTSCSILRISST